MIDPTDRALTDDEREYAKTLTWVPSNNESLGRLFRDRVIYLYDQVYPRATKIDAERWRMLTIGKPHVADWTEDDWRKAMDVLNKKVSRPRTPKNQDNRELGL